MFFIICFLYDKKKKLCNLINQKSSNQCKINKQTDCLSIVPDRKIRVFISSKCGIEEYDRVRAELKKKLEATQLIKAYCFETAGSSSYSAEKQFMSSLRFSDVCIFLIDNKDDVSEGVQKEVNAAMRYNKKSLFLCNALR